MTGWAPVRIGIPSLRPPYKSEDVFAEGCLERIGEDNPDEEQLFRNLWEDETQREVVMDCLNADCQVRAGRPTGY